MTITKNIWKIAALLLILSLISAVMISGTYAKYTSTYAGQDTALVAKWNIVATGGGITMADASTELDLFSHEYDNNITQTDGDGNYIIAPGVQGDFTLQLQNNSDVAAEVDFDIAKIAGSADVPIEYTATSPSGIFTTDLAALKTELNTGLDNVAAGGSVNKTVYWKWAFDGNDAVDTALGVSSAAINRTTYGLTVTASAVQVEPAQ